MANSKQKPAPEGAQRRPGKTKFSIPRREAPPVDGSYLDRLFADYEKQTKEIEGQDAGVPSVSEVPARQHVTDIPHPIPVDLAALTQPAKAVPAEFPQAGPPEVTVPSPPKEIVTTQVEEPSAVSPPEVSGAPVSTDVKSAGIVGQELHPPVHPAPTAEDEPLLEKWKKRHRLSKGEVKVLRVMVRMCRETGGDYCYIKIPQLMADAELKERQTQLVLRSLRGLGLVEKLAEYSNADRMGTKYRLVLESE